LTPLQLDWSAMISSMQIVGARQPDLGAAPADRLGMPRSKVRYTPAMETSSGPKLVLKMRAEVSPRAPASAAAQRAVAVDAAVGDDLGAGAHAGQQHQVAALGIHLLAGAQRPVDDQGGATGLVRTRAPGQLQGLVVVARPGLARGRPPARAVVFAASPGAHPAGARRRDRRCRARPGRRARAFDEVLGQAAHTDGLHLVAAQQAEDGRPVDPLGALASWAKSRMAGSPAKKSGMPPSIMWRASARRTASVSRRLAVMTARLAPLNSISLP
jgi:hypothetical protein